MAKSWWRSLAQRIAYPSWWPTAFTFDLPKGNEVPPRIGVRWKGRTAWYRLEREYTA